MKIRTKKIDKAREKLLKTINKIGLTPRELFIVWATLGYDIGESIHGQPETTEKLEELYFSAPALGVAMMLQSKISLSWLDDIKEETDD